MRNIFLVILGLASILGAIYCLGKVLGILVEKSENSIYVSGVGILFLFGVLLLTYISKRA
ncbi:MAG: hypothetical protein KBD52_01090 [Candidatus Pacebacteria bacterium]|nr:hypothetical protein [Candidatus Paceibacterota bacterium]